MEKELRLSRNRMKNAVNAGDFNKLSEKVIELYKLPKQQLDLMARSSKEYYLNNFNRNDLIDRVMSILHSSTSI